MAIGRITGPLLASNLRRDGIDIAIDDDLLYVDVVNGRIGIRQSAPAYELDVNTGTIRAAKIILNTATIGLMTIESSTSSSTVSTLFGPINIIPGGNDIINLKADTYVYGSLHATGDITADGDIRLGDTTSTDTLIVEAEIKSDLIPFILTGTFFTTVTNGFTVTEFVTNTNIISDYSLGSTTSYWQSAYLENIFTKQIDTVGTYTDVQFFPNIPLLERTLNKSVQINGDIRVYGGNPIGTFPVVNNILYVNENGSDDNDGRAMDSSRACRTISGATNSPYYKQGTVIKVAPGKYYENNPIELLPYTSVVGDSLRAVFVFPLNNAVDLFHVNSGVYITGMTMRDLRKGEVTRYVPGGAGTYTTGAYCVAFPPKLDNPIDVFHSPYIQNCTNQSGPWLYDGTMFVPNQTVQLPSVVATSTYAINTTVITVNILPEISGKMPEIGMSINGKGILIDPDVVVATIDSIENPDPNFQTAKRLLVDNKSFIQDEVVSYVDFFYSDLGYNKVKCRRDVGYIVDALVNDVILGGNESIVTAGKSYYLNNIQILGNETTATIAAFNRIGVIAKDIVSNITVTKTTGTVAFQSFNTSSNGGAVVVDGIDNSINLLVDILKNQTGYENAAALLNANRGFLQAEVVSFVNETYVGQPIPSFTYDRSKCFRDSGLIIDAIATDLLYGGNEQSFAAGRAYSQGAVIENEVDETIAAITYLGSIVRDVILKNQLLDSYQSTVTQITNLTTGTNAAVELVDRNLKLINVCIQGKQTPTEVANSNTPSAISEIVNSYDLLVANKAFLQHEVVAYVDTTFTKLDFVYDQANCERDTGLILDGLTLDLVYGGSSQSTFAGLQYWNQGTTEIPGEETITRNAFSYAKQISQQIVQNFTVSKLSTATQDTSVTATSVTVVSDLVDKYDVILNILTVGTAGVTDTIIPNGPVSTDVDVLYAVQTLKNNKSFIQDEVVAYVEANKPGGFVYDKAKCRRDAGYIVNSVTIDLLRGGNRQSVQAGVSYYGYNSTSTVLINEIPQTMAAYKYMKALVDKVVRRITATKTYQPDVLQNTDYLAATADESRAVGDNIDLIRKIIKYGPSAAPELTSIGLEVSTSTSVLRAYDLLVANRDFIVAEVVEFVNTTFINPYVFKYNKEKCFRDVGLIVDAVAQDIVDRSNIKSLEAGYAYWDNAVSVIEGQTRETAGAIQYFKNLALEVIANNPVTSLYQTSKQITVPGSSSTTATIVVPQLINSQLTGGYVARDLVRSNFDAITTIIESGPPYAPPSTNSTLTQFILHLSTSTIAAATNDIMYIGYTTVYPEEDKNMPGEWSLNGFADRRIDPNGSGGGALVDGFAPSTRSPIQSFVFDAFTQITQGGRGIHIINEGYAQLVSVFTIFCNVAVETDSGGIASITNSNNNFGDLCLLSRGYGRRKFGGTVYNPTNVAYNELTNSFEANEYYPQGYFPTNQEICVFVPDPANRPHISLVMEVVPPDEYVNYDGVTVPYVNEQGFPGFLTAIVNTSSLTTSSYTVNGIDVTGVSVGQTVYIRDQYGYESDDNGNGVAYLTTGTTITEVNYQSITLSNPILQGGGQYGNGNYFNIYCCGNAYYNILSSKTVTSPYPTGQSKILGQETETIDAINYLRDISNNVVSNILMTATYSTSVAQTIDNGFPSGNNSTGFISDSLGIITGVILAGPQAAPQVKTTGTAVAGKNDAIALLKKNKIFLMNETVSYVDAIYGGFTYDEAKCSRDTGLIVDSIAIDMLYDSISQSTFAGLQYWNQTSYTGDIPNEIVQTRAAINYLKSLVVSTAGGAPGVVAGQRFDNILDILDNGTLAITDDIVSNGFKTNDFTALAAVANVQANRESYKTQVINYITATYGGGFSYNEATCRRDVGYIVDSVCFDMLHGGNRQSIMAGVYYYGFNAADSAIDNQIPQTEAAYNFIKAIVGDIVTGTPTSPSFQTAISQVTNLNPATLAEAAVLQTKVDTITNIIRNGPDVAGNKVPIGLVQNSDPNRLKAFALLLANKEFIKAETIAYINETFPQTFVYNKQKCRRDAGLMIDALIADLQTGGNFRSVEAAKTYYTREGTYHIATLEDNVRNQLLFVDGSTVNFYQRSYQSASGYLFEYCGAGTQYGALPQVGRVDPEQTKEVVQLNNGKVFFTSTDQNGDFRIGPTLVISQATGVLSGRTFEKSLFAQMTPFILAVEAGAGE